MPSKRRPSKRKKRRAPKLWSPPKDWTPWLWAAFALNLAVGLVVSPVTGLASVRVVGGSEHDYGRVRNLLQHFEGTPHLRLNTSRVRNLMLDNPEVQSAEYQGNLFGRGVLTLTYKRPVAKVAVGLNVYLSNEGSVFRSTVDWPLRVSVQPPYEVGAPNLAVFSSWRSGAAARMCENIGERLPGREWTLVVTKNGFVDLLPDRGATIEFGSFAESDEKVEALVKILRDDPTILDEVSGLGLISPSNPVRVP